MRDKMILLYVIIFLMIAVIATIIGSNNAHAQMANYQNVDFGSAVVKADILNLRLGPGMEFPVVSKLYQGEMVRVFARINGWLIVQNDNNKVGMVKESYLTAMGSSGGVPANSAGSKNTGESSTGQSDESQLLSLINNARKNAGLKLLKSDSTLMKISEIKAEDLVKNKYFAHVSPVYGSPFDMMKKYGVKYRAAGENIAGSSTIKEAFDAWMKSESHKKNIMNKNFNYTGIGVVQSPTYGKILVQQFVGR